MTKTKYSNTRDSIALILFAFAFLLFAMATSCSSERKGCSMNRGMVGFGNR